MTDLFKKIRQHWLPAPTGWRFRTSATVELTVQTEVVEVSAGGSGLMLYLQHADGAMHKVLVAGFKASIGFSLASPINPAYGDDDFPSGGLGRIYKNTAKVGNALELKHFNGGYFVDSLEKSGLGHGASISLIAFGIPHTFMTPQMIPFGIPFCNGVGAIWGSCLQATVAGISIGGILGSGIVWE